MNGPITGARSRPLDVLVTQETVEERVCRAYESERDTIYRYLVSLGLDRVDAQELTQDVFLRLYVATRKGEQIQSLRAWLFTVASRLALNLRRNESRHPTVGDAVETLETVAASSLSPELALLRREQLAALREAIRHLPRQQQICLHLRAEGFRYRAIAEILDVKIPTVAEHLRRALTHLRKVIHG